MSTFFSSNGPSRTTVISNFAVNGKFLVEDGVAISRMYSVGDLWGSLTIRFSGILAGSSIIIIRTYDNTVLADITSASLNQEATINWYFPPETNEIQVIITKTGYYFINSIINLTYSSSKVIFLIDQIEVATGVNTDDIATAVWEKQTSAITIVGSYGVLVKTDLDATISSRADQTTVNSILSFIQTKVLTVAKFLGLK